MIEAVGLTKRLGGRTLLDGVSLRVRAGEAVAVMGPSGVGKTTLLRCLDGLERADAGTVRVGDDAFGPGAPDYGRAVARVRRRIGFVFQSWELFPHLTVLENVVEAPVHVARRAPEAAAREARALLERVGIAARAHARPHELSGGEQQRAAIARALALAPAALLMDEATSALDAARVDDLVALLRGLCADGLALLFVTHDVPFARALGTRVTALRDGTLREQPPRP
ncbi:MAG TPA: ATP-binding cassette domain-containing protein [Polyangia bacterium]|nr:ATP-binding cassette domain-containing protein [Polyangia bacterium]